MKVTIYKIVYVDEQVELHDFIDRHDCLPEFIDLSNPYYGEGYNFPGYPTENFIMVHQESYEGGLHELGYILCENEPSCLKTYIKEHISEFVPFEE